MNKVSGGIVALKRRSRAARAFRPLLASAQRRKDGTHQAPCCRAAAPKHQFTHAAHFKSSIQTQCHPTPSLGRLKKTLAAKCRCRQTWLSGPCPMRTGAVTGRQKPAQGDPLFWDQGFNSRLVRMGAASCDFARGRAIGVVLGWWEISIGGLWVFTSLGYPADWRG